MIFWAFFRENTSLKQTFKYSCIHYSKKHTNIELLINICWSISFSCWKIIPVNDVIKKLWEIFFLSYCKVLWVEIYFTKPLTLVDARNYIQERPTQILDCTMWDECKQTQFPHRSWRERTTALMCYYSPTKNKLIYQVRANTYDFCLSDQYEKYNIFLFHPLGPFPSKLMRCPWILYFDLLPLQYTDMGDPEIFLGCH